MKQHEMTSPAINSTGLPVGFSAQFRSLVARKLVRNTLVFSMAEVANKAIPFLLLPIITRYMGPADYGKVAVFMAVVSRSEERRVGKECGCWWLRAQY